MSKELQADKKLDEACRMIIQAYEAGFIDKFRAWEEIQIAVQQWEKAITPRRSNLL